MGRPIRERAGLTTNSAIRDWAGPFSLISSPNTVYSVIGFFTTFWSNLFLDNIENFLYIFIHFMLRHGQIRALLTLSSPSWR